jgi:protease-4
MVAAHRLVCVVGLLAVAGCRHGGMTVNTNARLTMTKPLEGRMATDMAPRRDTGPLREMTVANRAEADACVKIAILDVDGVLVNSNQVGPYSEGENPLALFREKLDCAAADPAIRGVVVRINSPGGGVAVCDTMHHELLQFKLRKGVPVVAYVMEVGTGGGYYLATAADTIYAQPTAAWTCSRSSCTNSGTLGAGTTRPPRSTI